jgi:hypothetical protein
LIADGLTTDVIGPKTTLPAQGTETSLTKSHC